MVRRTRCSNRRALELISGDWIARIDDDDIWTNDHLEKLLNHAVKMSEFVSSSYTTIVNNQKMIKDFSLENPAVGGVQTWLYVSYLKFLNLISIVGKILA